jgi:hypothetical protein
MPIFLRNLRNLVVLGGGVAAAGYGVIDLLGVDEVLIGKFTSGARDSISTPLLLIAIGVFAVLFSVIDWHNNKR